jgi:hypothetical protein
MDPMLNSQLHIHRSHLPGHSPCFIRHTVSLLRQTMDQHPSIYRVTRNLRGGRFHLPPLAHLFLGFHQANSSVTFHPTTVHNPNKLWIINLHNHKLAELLKTQAATAQLGRHSRTFPRISSRDFLAYISFKIELHSRTNGGSLSCKPAS